jgi:hypothetical protein
LTSIQDALEDGDAEEDLAASNMPWANLPKRWGHPWHSMCSYLGTYPAALARSFITLLSEPGDVVLDPFSGRGTTLLECRLTGRVPLASDLNPIAVSLSRAKNATVFLADVLDRIDRLERKYDALLYVPEAQVQADNILLIYHPRTLAQLCYLRRRLQWISDVDAFLIGAVLGIMHGSVRQDGSSSYASISMPNTFSMSPEYVRKFVETNRLQRVDRNVFALLRAKVQRLFREGTEFKSAGVVVRADAKRLTEVPEFTSFAGRVKLILCSPPYLDVVNYAKQNWIRTWFLSEHPDAISENLDDNLTLAEWLEFAKQVSEQMKTMLAPNGAAVLVIGDVAKANRSVSLAREFIRHMLHDKIFAYVGCLSDHIQADIKTTRIWKETKGQATNVDRVVVLANRSPVFDFAGIEEAMFRAVSVNMAHVSASEMANYARSFAGGHALPLGEAS